MTEFLNVCTSYVCKEYQLRITNRPQMLAANSIGLPPHPSRMTGNAEISCFFRTALYGFNANYEYD